MKNVIIGMVKNIQDSFNTSELAYLLLTSKNENHIRDRIAYKLHSKYYPKKLIGREWKRVDLAVFKKKMMEFPEALIEIKLSSTFYLVGKRNGTPRSMNDLKKDIEKAYLLAGEDTSVFGILFLAHARGKIDNIHYKKIIKQYSRINSQLKKHKSYDEVLNKSVNIVRTYYENFGYNVNYGIMALGKAFDVKVDLAYFLIGR